MPLRTRFASFLRFIRITFLVLIAMLPLPLVTLFANVFKTDRRAVPTLSERKKRED